MESGTAQSPRRVTVADPWMITRDQALVHAGEALDPVAVARGFAVAKFTTEDLSGERLQSIRVTRHKPGRRCVIEYQLAATDNSPQMTLIGKIRRKRSGRSAFELSRAFTARGFHATAADRISVPDAVAYVKKLGLWLQRKVSGPEATALLLTPAGPAIATRIADAAYKMHRSNVPVERFHGIDNELEILESCLDKVALVQPTWKFRIERLKLGAQRLAQTLGHRKICGIHRDFYADQIIVDDDRLWLLDFDLYCQGDPALDIGNFIGHVTEQSLRIAGHPKALAAVEQAIEDRYVALAGDTMRYAIRVYALLTLMRHIYLSLQHESRRHTTQRLLSLCETRVVGMLCDPGEPAKAK